MADNKENIGILDNLPDQVAAPGTPPEVGTDRSERDILANLPDQGADPNAVLGLTGAPNESGMDSTLRNFLSFGVDPNVYNTVKGDFDSQAKLHPQGNGMLNVTNMKLDARAEQHAADPSIPVIRQGQPLTGWQKSRVWFEDQFGITAKRQLEFEAQREGLSPEELADRVGANNVRLDRYLKFDPATGAAGVLEGVAGGLEWLTDGEIGGDFANQMQILRDEMSPVDPNFLDQVSQGAGSMAMFFIPGLGVGSGVTRIFATAPRVANILGASTMTGMEAMTEAGLVWRDVFRKTNDQEQADKAANATFWLNVPLLFVTNKLGIFAEGGNSLNRFIRSAALEGTQEAGQEIISASATGEEIKFKDLATAFGVGAIIGGGAGSITGALQRVEVEGVEPPATPPTSPKVSAVSLADLDAQVEAGTITEEQAIEDAIESRLVPPIAERLIDPLRGEEGAVTIDEEPAPVRTADQELDALFDENNVTEEQQAEFDRLLERTASPEVKAKEQADFDALVAKLFDTPEKRAAFDRAHTRAEITRGFEERKPAKTLRQVIEDELASPLARAEALAEGRKLLDEKGTIDLNNPIALDLIRNRLSNFAANPRTGAQDVLNIGRAVFAEGKAQVQDFTTRMKEIAGEAWESIKPYIQRAWEILNNEVGAIGRAQTDTPAFKAWFKDSKVVDENGKPLVVYHGTSAQPFGVFKSEDGEFFFTDNPAVSAEFGARREDVYINLENPYIVDFKGEKTGKDVFDAIDHAKANGFDGVIAKNVSEGQGVPIHQQIVAFEPTQIKSATGNVGTFAPTVADIRGSIDLNAEISLAPVIERLQKFAENPEQGAKDMMTLANSVWAEGKTQVKDFMARMKEVLGDLFEALRPHAQKAWNILANEEGAIRIGPEGQAEINLEDRVQAIRLQARSKELPAFMEENDTWSEAEVDTALDKAQQGKPITEREAEIVHATLAEAGANFYQEAIEDEFITLEPEEVDEIIQTGIQDFVSKLEVVKPIELTAEQKRKKERTQEFARRGKEIKTLQDTLKEQAFLLHQSVQDQASIRQEAKLGTKAARDEVKRLESKIETRDKQVVKLREKAKGAARALPKPTVKAQIRQATGLSKAEIALVREDVALKEGIRQAMRASREAFRAGRQEGIAEAETRLQTLIDEAKARAKREATGKKIIALTISENLPPGVRGQFVKALADARTPGQFTNLATRVGDAIEKFNEAQQLKKNLATQRQKLGFIRKVGEFNQTVINEIKQEVGLTKPLAQATEAQLSAITDRLKARLRFKRSRGFNPQIEDRKSKKPEIQEVVYKANRDLSLNQKSEFRRKFDDIVEDVKDDTLDRTVGIISSRLADINLKLRTALRKFEFKTMTQIQKDQKAVLPFLDKAAKMSKDDHFDFDLAVKNGDIDKINELIDKYDMKAEYDKVRSTLDDIYKRANDVGFDIGYQQNYFPRQIKDTKGFLEWFAGREDWSIIQEAIQRKEMALGRRLEFDEKVSLINTMIRGYSGGNITLSDTGAMKQRVIDFVSPELNQFYEDSLSTLANYIGQVDEAIEQRVFFGKSRPIDGEAEEFNNLNDSLGFYIADLITQGLISPSQEKEIRQILQARFGERGTSGVIGLYKNLSYVTLLGNPFSAVTQLGDMGFSLYAGGPVNVLTSLPRAIIGKSVISKEDIGIEKIAAEVENKSRVADLVDRVFRITGLTKMDTIGKETLINSVILKYQKIARNEAEDVKSFEAFESQMQEIFEDETAQLIEDLRNDIISENVKFLAFNELLNFQPIALSEVPERYLTAGNGRIFYALKTWTLKMLDVYRNEVFRTMKTDKVQGVKNMMRLSAWLVATNATADIIKSIMKGEDLDDEDTQYDILIDNLMMLIGFSRYSLVQARRDGIGSAVTDQISPPTNIVDDIWRDVGDQFKDSDKSFDVNNLRSIKNIPVIGQLYYWWFGRAADKKKRK